MNSEKTLIKPFSLEDPTPLNTVASEAAEYKASVCSSPSFFPHQRPPKGGGASKDDDEQNLMLDMKK